MPAFELMSPGELARLDVAISVLPDSRLLDRTGLWLMRHGVLPPDVVRLHRVGFWKGEPGSSPAQVRGAVRGQEEDTILSEAAAVDVDMILRSHQCYLIVPGMTAKRLEQLLADRLSEAGVRQVTPVTLRNSVRMIALAGGPV